MISNWISENYCDKNHFDKASPDYNIALKNSVTWKYHIYFKSIQAPSLKQTNYLVESPLLYVMPNMNNVIRKNNCKIMKNPVQSTTKICNCRRKTDCRIDGNYLSECRIYKASVSKTINKYYYGAITINIPLEMNLVKRILNCTSMYGNWKREILIILLIAILLWNRRNIFLGLKSGINAFVKSFLLQEQILMFCSMNEMRLR